VTCRHFASSRLRTWWEAVPYCLPPRRVATREYFWPPAFGNPSRGLGSEERPAENALDVSASGAYNTTGTPAVAGVTDAGLSTQ